MNKKMNKNTKVRKAIGAIIASKGKFLLVSRNQMLTKSGMKKIPPEWDLMKGGIEKNESPEDALIRELYEETGSKKYSIIKRFEEKIGYNLPEESGFAKQEVMMFLVEYNGDAKELKGDAKEITNLAFFSRQEALAKIKYEETKDFFERHTKQ